MNPSPKVNAMPRGFSTGSTVIRNSPFAMSVHNRNEKRSIHENIHNKKQTKQVK